MLARESMVRHLMTQVAGAMEDACQADPSITADEVCSAYVTLTRNVMRVAVAAGAEPRRLQSIVHGILLECGDVGRPN